MDKKLQVLLLEDEPDDAEFAERELRNAGMVFSSLRVDTRAAFVAALEDCLPDLILADYHLPAFDGMAALEIARGKAPHVPFIFVSGALGEDLAIETLHRGAADYVLKGRLAKLVPAVKRALLDADERRRRKEAERALAAFNRDFEAFLAQTADFVYFKDADSRFRFCSQTMARITGHASWRDMIGKNDKDVFPADTARIYQEEEQPIFAEGRALLDKIDPYYDADGRPGYVQTSKLPLFDEGGKVVGIFGISRDITERMAQHDALERQVRERTAQLRTMSIELTTAEHRERQAIAQDLHDGLGQTLAVAKLKLSALDLSPELGSRNASLKQEVKEIELLLDQANQAVRSLSLQLSPPALHVLGLVPALGWLAEEMLRSFGLRVQVHDDGLPKLLDEAVLNPIFRATRELLINVAKHAAVGVAVVTATCDDNRLVLSVADAGTGFDARNVSAPSAAGGYGLFSVRERIDLMGGDMQIDSRPGDGTVVVLTVPLAQDRPSAA